MSNKYAISVVPKPLLGVVWPLCIEHIQKAVDKAPEEVSVESTEKKLLLGNALLVAVSEGPDVVAANTLEVCTYDTGHKALFIPIVGGTGWDEWGHDFLVLAKCIAKDYGCTELRGMSVRPGWLRKLNKEGWEEVHTIIKCKIEE